jgi:hypothetical protein
MTTFTSPFTGDIVQPTDVSYTPLSFGANVTLAWPAYVAPNSGQISLARIMDCTATASGLSISLPPGSQGAVGTDTLIRNVGSNTFTVTDSAGFESATVAAGQARYFYLTDNTTPSGTWANFTYGTGTSAADAASLAGAGLSALLGKLVSSSNVIEVFSNPTLDETDRATTYVWIGGASPFTLPASSSINTGWYMMLRNSGSGALTVTPQGTSKINANTTQVFNPGDSAIICFEKGTGNFFTVGLTNQNAVTLTSSTYDVDSVIGNTLSLVSNAPNIQSFVALSGTRTQTLKIVLPTITQLYVINNNTGQTGYNISFQVSGSSQTPVPFSNGTVALILTDGLNVFTLTSVAAGTFFANNGSAAAPSFSFLNDLTTGLYLKSVGALGISANGTQMIAVDNSNPSAPHVDVTGTLTATLITGGVF